MATWYLGGWTASVRLEPGDIYTLAGVKRVPTRWKKYPRLVRLIVSTWPGLWEWIVRNQPLHEFHAGGR